MCFEAGTQLEGHLHALAADVHLDQRVPNQVSEATAVKVAVGPRVAPPVVDLRELQASVEVEVLPVEVLVSAADLQRKAGRLVDPPGSGGAGLPTYFVLAGSYGGGRAAVAGVQVLVVGCVTVHVEGQDKTPREDPAQGVIHLQENRPWSACCAPAAPCSPPPARLPRLEPLRTCAGSECCS